MSFRATDAPGGGFSSVEATPQPFSLVDRHSSVDGTLRSSHNLRVEGRVQGAIQCSGTLYVAEDSAIDAEVVSEEIIVAGTLSGTITCRGRLEIRSTGVVHGAVETGRLVILEGGVYEGHLTMAQTESARRTDVEPSAGNETESEPRASMSSASGTTGNYPFLRSFTPPARSGDDYNDLPAAVDDVDEDDDTE